MLKRGELDPWIPTRHELEHSIAHDHVEPAVPEDCRLQPAGNRFAIALLGVEVGVVKPRVERDAQILAAPIAHIQVIVVRVKSNNIICIKLLRDISYSADYLVDTKPSRCRAPKAHSWNKWVHNADSGRSGRPKASVDTRRYLRDYLHLMLGETLG
jgi:hypothetical protein